MSSSPSSECPQQQYQLPGFTVSTRSWSRSSCKEDNSTLASLWDNALRIQQQVADLTIFHGDSGAIPSRQRLRVLTISSMQLAGITIDDHRQSLLKQRLGGTIMNTRPTQHFIQPSEQFTKPTIRSKKKFQRTLHDYPAIPCEGQPQNC